MYSSFLGRHFLWVNAYLRIAQAYLLWMAGMAELCQAFL